MVKKFNDLLALAVVAGVIPGLWIANGVGLISLPGEVVGATIMAWGLILQYYFRKKPAETSAGAT